MYDLKGFNTFEDLLDCIEKNLKITVYKSYLNLATLKRLIRNGKRFMLFTSGNLEYTVSGVQTEKEAFNYLAFEADIQFHGSWPHDGNISYEAFFVNADGSIDPIVNVIPNRWEDEAW